MTLPSAPLTSRSANRNSTNSNLPTKAIDPSKLQTSQQAKTEAKTNGGVLAYPESHLNSSGQWVVLSQYNYNRSYIGATPQLLPNANISIKLPLPINLATAYNANWGQIDLGAFGNFLQTNFGGAARDFYNNGHKSIENYFNKFKNEFKHPTDLAKNMGSNAAKLAKQALGAVAIDALSHENLFQQFGLANGIARNPFQALTFQNMNFRSFDFSYKFTPESYQDSNTLLTILKTLKKSMHPSLDQKWTNNLYDYPNMYKVQFSNPDFLFDFGMCVITNVNVNYHGEGFPSYHNSNSTKQPTSIGFSINFLEIEINTQETFDKSNR